MTNILDKNEMDRIFESVFGFNPNESFKDYIKRKENEQKGAEAVKKAQRTKRCMPGKRGFILY